MKKILLLYPETLPPANSPITSIQEASDYAAGYFLRLMGIVTGLANSLTAAGYTCSFKRARGHEQAERGKTVRVPFPSIDGSDKPDVVVIFRDLKIEEFDHQLEFGVLEAGALLVIVDPLARVPESGFQVSNRAAWCSSDQHVISALAALLSQTEG